MELSLFPAGKYIAKTVEISCKNTQGIPYALEFAGGPSKSAKIWDINAFRPDPQLKKSPTSAVVLYESVNTIAGECSKIPRYILMDGEKWIVNVR